MSDLPSLLCCECFCPGLSLAHYQNVSFLFLCSPSLFHIFTFPGQLRAAPETSRCHGDRGHNTCGFPKLKLPLVGLFLITLNRTRTNGSNYGKGECLCSVDSGESTRGLNHVLSPLPLGRCVRVLTLLPQNGTSLVESLCGSNGVKTRLWGWGGGDLI